MIWYFRALAKYAIFSGRARRKEYWYFFLFYLVFAVVAGAIIGALHLDSDIWSRVYQFAFIIPAIAVGVRRMHDINRSGWYILIPIYSLILACENGMAGNNEYGPDPKIDTNTVYGADDYQKPFDINPE